MRYVEACVSVTAHGGDVNNDTPCVTPDTRVTCCARVTSHIFGTPNIPVPRPAVVFHFVLLYSNVVLRAIIVSCSVP